jgi:hypothetical protein
MEKSVLMKTPTTINNDKLSWEYLYQILYMTSSMTNTTKREDVDDDFDPGTQFIKSILLGHRGQNCTTIRQHLLKSTHEQLTCHPQYEVSSSMMTIEEMLDILLLNKHVQQQTGIIGNNTNNDDEWIEFLVIML